MIHQAHFVSPADRGVRLPAGGNRLAFASTAVPALSRFEGHRLEVDRHKEGNPILITANVVKNRPFIDLANLKACSEAYDISSNPKDYVFTEIPANNVGIPNRNMDAFELSDVTEWRPELGRIAWATYRWKAANADHNNKIPHLAKGVIFDSYMQQIEGHWFIKVVAGWCRQKDPRLARRILTNQDAGYSMACLVGRAMCSICGYASSGGNVTCKHIKGGIGKGTIWPATGQLVYERCLWERSLISTARGLVPMKNVRVGDRVWTLSGWKPVSRVWVNGLRAVRSVHTTQGHRLRATEDHNFYVVKDLELIEQPLDSLRKGDWVVIPNGGSVTEDIWLPSPKKQEGPGRWKSPIATPGQLTPALARMLGYLVAEGTIRDDRIWFANYDQEVLDDWHRCVRNTFGQDYYGPNLLSGWESSGNSPTRQPSINRRMAVDFLHKCGLASVKAKSKDVPHAILRASDDMVAEFLQGYWIGDGWVSDDNGNALLGASSKSRKLMRRIQLLIGRWGIVSTIRKDRESGANGITMWKLLIYGQFARKLYQKIFYGELEDPTRKSRTLQDVIPGTAGLPRILRENYNTGRGRSARTHLIDGTIRKCLWFGPPQTEGDLSRSVVRSMIPNIMKVDPKLGGRLLALIRANARFCQIKSIGKPIVVPVRNLTVEDAHHYVADGLLVSNCGRLNYFEISHVEDRADIDSVKNWAA